MLQKLIDRANEKGWRREYPSCWLCEPSGQTVSILNSLLLVCSIVKIVVLECLSQIMISIRKEILSFILETTYIGCCILIM